jgi:putative aldouronate transport system permease protein
MRIGKTFGSRVAGALNVLFLSLLSYAMLYPVLYVLFASLSDPHRLATHPGLLWHPVGFNLNVYKMAFSNEMLLVGYRNTLLYLALGLVFNLTLTTLGAYGLSRKNLLLGKFFMFAIVFTMLFSGGLIPTYLVVFRLGLVHTIWSMILPSAVSTWNLIILRTSFQGIPASLNDAAKIDGANDLHVLLRIMLPISKAIMAVMVLFYGVGIWNSWFGASIYLTERTMYPLQLVLREILIQGTLDDMMIGTAQVDMHMIGESLKYATAMIATIPILIMYPLLQKYFVQGVMIGAIKG